MKVQHHRRALLLILTAVTLLGACEAPRTGGYPVAPTYYYVAPATSFLRDCPGYECGIVTQVFSGDRVTVLDRNDYGWAQTQLDRTGAIGWIPGDLLSAAPLPATLYVALNNVYLRDCADYNCRGIELLQRGDRVDKLDQDARGWYRVTSQRTRNSGWVPAAAVSPSPGPSPYYVNVSSLALRAGPSTGHKVLATLGLNNQVEVIGSGLGGWVQVRDVRTGIIGWVAARYLESFPVRHPKAAAPKKPAPEESPKRAPKAM